MRDVEILHFLSSTKYRPYESNDQQLDEQEYFGYIETKDSESVGG